MTCCDPFDPLWCRNSILNCLNQNDTNSFFMARFSEVGLCLQQLKGTTDTLTKQTADNKNKISNMDCALKKLRTEFENVKESQTKVTNDFMTLQGSFAGFQESISQTVETGTQTISKFGCQLSTLQAAFDNYRIAVTPESLKALQTTYEDVAKTFDTKIKAAITAYDQDVVQPALIALKARNSEIAKDLTERMDSVEKTAVCSAKNNSKTLSVLQKSLDEETARASQAEGVLMEGILCANKKRRCLDNRLSKELCEEKKARKDQDDALLKLINDNKVSADDALADQAKKFDASLAEQAQKFDAAIAAQAQKFDAALAAQAQKFDAALAEQKKSFDDLVTSEIDQRKNDVDQINQRLDALEKGK